MIKGCKLCKNDEIIKTKEICIECEDPDKDPNYGCNCVKNECSEEK